MKYQIIGDTLPALIMQLEQGESVLSEAGGRSWSRGPVLTETTSGGGAGKVFGRMISGESLFLSKYTAQGNAEIAFSSSFPGKIIARELKQGESIICQKSAFLCGFGNIDLSIHFRKKLTAGLFGGEGFIMEKVTGPGIVFLELDGYSPVYELSAGEKLICDTGVVAVMDSTCSLDVQMVKGVKNMFFGGEGLFDTVVTGPGKVYMQTMTIPNLAKKIAPYIVTSK